MNVKIEKKYFEFLILIIGGIIYGLSKKYLSNDWIAVLIAGTFFIFAKIIIKKIRKM